jgi:hypothetical protein
MQERNQESTQPRFSGKKIQLTIRYFIKEQNQKTWHDGKEAN